MLNKPSFALSPTNSPEGDSNAYASDSNTNMGVSGGMSGMGGMGGSDAPPNKDSIINSMNTVSTTNDPIGTNANTKDIDLLVNTLIAAIRVLTNKSISLVLALVSFCLCHLSFHYSSSSFINFFFNRA